MSADKDENVTPERKILLLEGRLAQAEEVIQKVKAEANANHVNYGHLERLQRANDNLAQRLLAAQDEIVELKEEIEHTKEYTLEGVAGETVDMDGNLISVTVTREAVIEYFKKLQVLASDAIVDPEPGSPMHKLLLHIHSSAPKPIDQHPVVIGDYSPDGNPYEQTTLER